MACNPGGPDDREISAAVRALFLAEIVELLLDYQPFVLVPESQQEWLDGAFTQDPRGCPSRADYIHCAWVCPQCT